MKPWRKPPTKLGTRGISPAAESRPRNVRGGCAFAVGDDCRGARDGYRFSGAPFHSRHGGVHGERDGGLPALGHRLAHGAEPAATAGGRSLGWSPPSNCCTRSSRSTSPSCPKPGSWSGSRPGLPLPIYFHSGSRRRTVRSLIDCTPSYYRFWAVADAGTDRCLGLPSTTMTAIFAVSARASAI